MRPQGVVAAIAAAQESAASSSAATWPAKYDLTVPNFAYTGPKTPSKVWTLTISASIFSHIVCRYRGYSREEDVFVYDSFATCTPVPRTVLMLTEHLEFEICHNFIPARLPTSHAGCLTVGLHAPACIGSPVARRMQPP